MDADSVFNSNDMVIFCEARQIQPHYVSIYRQQGNGRAELLIRTMKDWLKGAATASTAYVGSWVHTAYDVMWTYNASVNSVNTVSGFPLYFHMTGRTFLHTQREQLQDLVLEMLCMERDTDVLVRDTVAVVRDRRVQESQHRVARCVQRVDVPAFVVGDWVRYKVRGVSHALAARYDGPVKGCGSLLELEVHCEVAPGFILSYMLNDLKAHVQGTDLSPPEKLRAVSYRPHRDYESWLLYRSSMQEMSYAYRQQLSHRLRRTEKTQKMGGC